MELEENFEKDLIKEILFDLRRIKCSVLEAKKRGIIISDIKILSEDELLKKAQIEAKEKIVFLTTGEWS